jgi:hypothetical protein
MATRKSLFHIKIIYYSCDSRIIYILLQTKITRLFIEDVKYTDQDGFKRNKIHTFIFTDMKFFMSNMRRITNIRHKSNQSIIFLDFLRLFLLEK